MATPLIRELEEPVERSIRVRVAAHHHAKLLANKRHKGLAMAPFNAQIAATALAVGAFIAARNTADFAECGVVLVDPWLPQPVD